MIKLLKQAYKLAIFDKKLKLKKTQTVKLIRVITKIGFFILVTHRI